MNYWIRHHMLGSFPDPAPSSILLFIFSKKLRVTPATSRLHCLPLHTHLPLEQMNTQRQGPVSTGRGRSQITHVPSSLWPYPIVHPTPHLLPA